MNPVVYKKASGLHMNLSKLLNNNCEFHDVRNSVLTVSECINRVFLLRCTNVTVHLESLPIVGLFASNCSNITIICKSDPLFASHTTLDISNTVNCTVTVNQEQGMVSVEDYFNENLKCNGTVLSQWQYSKWLV